jgi:hypothetical protein
MTEKEASQFCDQWLPAWTGNQAQKLIQFYADDAIYRDPTKPQGLNGREEIFDYFERLLNRNPNWKWTRQEVFPTPKGFTLKWLAEIPSSDGFVQIEGLDIVEFNNQNKIVRNEVYFDPSPLARLGRS